MAADGSRSTCFQALLWYPGAFLSRRQKRPGAPTWRGVNEVESGGRVEDAWESGRSPTRDSRPLKVNDSVAT